jgi:hypothetical protein
VKALQKTADKDNPFGGTISSSGSVASANIYRFSSKEIHVNSGMYRHSLKDEIPEADLDALTGALENSGFQWGDSTVRWGVYDDGTRFVQDNAETFIQHK